MIYLEPRPLTSTHSEPREWAIDIPDSLVAEQEAREIVLQAAEDRRRFTNALSWLILLVCVLLLVSIQILVVLWYAIFNPEALVNAIVPAGFN